jgi:dUTP pyrophosphatase
MTAAAQRVPPEIEVEVKQLPHGRGLPLPHYASDGAAGMDLRAATPEGGTVELAPGERLMVPTGIAIALPQGFEAQVRPRSGLAIRHGITCLNSPGTVDSDYRGEINVILVNLGRETFRIERGDRIAQLVVAPVARAVWRLSEELAETSRGAGGFGSSGVK